MLLNILINIHYIETLLNFWEKNYKKFFFVCIALRPPTPISGSIAKVLVLVKRFFIYFKVREYNIFFQSCQQVFTKKEGEPKLPILPAGRAMPCQPVPSGSDHLHLQQADVPYPHAQGSARRSVQRWSCHQRCVHAHQCWRGVGSLPCR